MTKHFKSKAKIKKFLNSIAELGDKQQACAKSKIPVSTVNNWLRSDEEFKNHYQKALTQYYTTDKNALVSLCYQNMVLMLLGQSTTRKKVVKKVYPASGEYIYDENGVEIPNQPIQYKVEEEEKTIPTPRWVYDRILGFSDVQLAMSTLINSGLFSQDAIDRVAKVANTSAIEAQKVLQQSTIALADSEIRS